MTKKVFFLICFIIVFLNTLVIAQPQIQIEKEIDSDIAFLVENADRIFQSVSFLNKTFAVSNLILPRGLSAKITNIAEILFKDLKKHNYSMKYLMEKEYYEILLVANAAYKVKEYLLCNKIVTHALEKYGYRPAIYRFLGATSFWLSKYDDAEKYFLRTYSDNTSSHYLKVQSATNLGMLYTIRGMLYSANSYLKFSLRENDEQFWDLEFANSLNNQGNFLIEKKYYAEALKVYKQASVIFLPREYSNQHYGINANILLASILNAKELEQLNEDIESSESLLNSIQDVRFNQEREAICDNISLACLKITREHNRNVGSVRNLLRKAFNNSQKAIEYNNEGGLLHNLAQYYYRLGCIVENEHFPIEEYDLTIGNDRIAYAKKCFERAIELSYENKLNSLVKSSAEKLLAIEEDPANRIIVIFKKLNALSEMGNSASIYLVDTLISKLDDVSEENRSKIIKSIKESLFKTREIEFGGADLAISTRKYLVFRLNDPVRFYH